MCGKKKLTIKKKKSFNIYISYKEIIRSESDINHIDTHRS